jgi:hypothetical protein
MSNHMEGRKMGELDELDLAQIAAREQASAESKTKLKKILGRHKLPPTLKEYFGEESASNMRQEAVARDYVDRKKLPDY